MLWQVWHEKLVSHFTNVTGLSQVDSKQTQTNSSLWVHSRQKLSNILHLFDTPNMLWQVWHKTLVSHLKNLTGLWQIESKQTQTNSSFWVHSRQKLWKLLHLFDSSNMLWQVWHEKLVSHLTNVTGLWQIVSKQAQKNSSFWCVK